ncbi:glycosyltransferase, partial [bacterium]|nr:glycosyltransferase [bacterium]
MPRLTKDSKRVALVITRLDRGGSAELTMQLAAGLSQNGYTVLLISGKTVEPFWDPVQYAHDNNFSLQYVNSLIRSLHPIRDIVALIQIVNIFRKFRPDILHTNSSKAGLLGRLAGHLC